jgi:hypothetical protein
VLWLRVPLRMRPVTISVRSSHTILFPLDTSPSIEAASDRKNDEDRNTQGDQVIPITVTRIRDHKHQADDTQEQRKQNPYQTFIHR